MALVSVGVLYAIWYAMFLNCVFVNEKLSEVVIHFYDSKTGRGLCGVKLSEVYPFNCSSDSDRVTCVKCLERLPKVTAE